MTLELTDTELDPQRFAADLLAWFDRHGRHDLPWQHPRSAYRVWVSEVMLQQTQVSAVIPYFERFMQRFPDIAALSSAPVDDVLALWAGLGYYARARNLHRAAQAIAADHHGEFPQDFESVLALPGIGRSTAGAILAQAFDAPYPILDGNVKRVLSRLLELTIWPGERTAELALWETAERLTPKTRVADYTQAIMDLGATLCTRAQPSCLLCPLKDRCRARQNATTAEIPRPRPKRARPRRSTHMLVLMGPDAQVLLQRRPPDGIWGGLWSLPESPDPEGIASLLVRLGVDASTHEPLPPVRHGFTHFELEIHPVLVRSTRTPACVAESTTSDWCRLGLIQNGERGVPAAVARILAGLPEYESRR